MFLQFLCLYSEKHCSLTCLWRTHASAVNHQTVAWVSCAVLSQLFEMRQWFLHSKRIKVKKNNLKENPRKLLPHSIVLMSNDFLKIQNYWKASYWNNKELTHCIPEGNNIFNTPSEYIFLQKLGSSRRWASYTTSPQERWLLSFIPVFNFIFLRFSNSECNLIHTKRFLLTLACLLFILIYAVIWVYMQTHSELRLLFCFRANFYKVYNLIILFLKVWFPQVFSFEYYSLEYEISLSQSIMYTHNNSAKWVICIAVD